MLTEALNGLDVTADRAMMVGDRLGTDIKMGVDGGMKTALVLTGDSTLEEAQALPEQDRPTYVLDRVDRLLPPWVWEEMGWTEDNDEYSNH